MYDCFTKRRLNNLIWVLCFIPASRMVPVVPGLINTWSNTGAVTYTKSNEPQTRDVQQGEKI